MLVNNQSLAHKANEAFKIHVLTVLFFLIISHKVTAMNKTTIDLKVKQPNIIIVTDATERDQGLSHGYLGFQDSQNNKSHFFLAHLQPQPNGAAFASFVINVNNSLLEHQKMFVHGVSLNDRHAIYQLIIHTNESKQLGFTYKHDFTIDAKSEFNYVASLIDFSASRRGENYPNAPHLIPSNIIAIGLRIIGRASEDVGKFQSGLYGLQLFELGLE